MSDVIDRPILEQEVAAKSRLRIIDCDVHPSIHAQTDLHQFMLYTPVPGTPLYFEMKEQGRMLDIDLADARVVPRGKLRKSTSGKLARGGNREWYLNGTFGAVAATVSSDE